MNPTLARGVTRVDPRLTFAVALSVAAGWCAAVGPDPIQHFAERTLLGERPALLLGIVGGCGFLVLAIRAVARARDVALVARLVLYGYFSLLFLGLAAVSALRILKSKGWPIAATQPLPAQSDVARAFWISAIGGALILAGSWVGSHVLPRLERRHAIDRTEWAHLRIIMPWFAVLGLLGGALVLAKTRQLALFASNIDVLRFSQGSGLGYASLLEYELLLAACIAGCALSFQREFRRFAVLTFSVSLVALVILRAERTPLIVAAGVCVIAHVFADGGHRRRIALLVFPILLAVVLGLGLFRLESSVGPLGRERSAVRALFDVSPEFREASYVYRIYPGETPFVGSRAIGAAVSSLLPSRAVGLVGLNKSSVYGDISHEYSATMHRLAIYPQVAPLRVGLGAELWADAGAYGFAFGLFAYGLIVGLIGALRPRDAVGVVRKSIVAVLLLMALITPTTALLPIGLMLLGPLALLRPLGLVYRESGTR